MKKVILLTVCALIMSSVNASSQPLSGANGEYLELFREYAVKTDLASTASQIFTSFIELKSRELTAEQVAKLNEAVPAIVDECMDSYINEAAKIYEKHISAEELMAIIEFYDSPAGKKLVATQMEITREMLPLSSELSDAVSKKIDSILK